MLKSKQKFIAVIFLIIATVSTLCFAENSDDVAPISEEAVTSEEGTNVDENQAELPSEGENTEGEGTEGEATEGTEEEQEPNLIESDSYLIGENVTVEKTDYIDGNVYIIGSNEVTVSGQIGGDLFILANKVNLTEDSYTYGNLYVCASELTINGIVCDLYAACPTITIGETGIVLRDSRTISNTFALNGSIGRNTFMESSEVSMAESAHVYGSFNYSSNDEIIVPSGAVDGNINYEPIKVNSENIGDVIYSYALDFVYTLVYTLVVFGLIIFIAPKFVSKIQEIGKTKKLASFGIGLLLLILIPIIALLLVFTVIGTPLSFAVAALYALIISITFTVTAIFFSKMLSDKVAALSKFNGVFALAIITLVLWALTQIPFFIGGIVKLLITIFGFGVFILSIFAKENN